MRHECRITVIDKKCFTDYQEQYLADPKSGPCPFFNVGDTFLVYGVSGALATVYMTSGNLSGYGGNIKTSTIYYYLYGGMQVVSDPVG